MILGPRRKHAVLGQSRSRLLLCRAPVAHTHVSTFGIYSSHGSRENVATESQTDRPTDYNNPSLRMRARGLIILDHH